MLTHFKGHFFSEDSDVTHRPDAKTQISLVLANFFQLFLDFSLKITQ